MDLLNNKTEQKSKEVIMQRMFSHAASFWGVRSIDDLDPLVIRLIEALASELYTVNNEICNMNNRILESLAGVLTPSMLIAPRPAHSVVQATPFENFLFLDKHTILLDRHVPQEMKKFGMIDISFLPVGNVRLISGKIDRLICERMFFQMESGGRKKLAGRAHTLNEQINNTVWIRLELHPEIESMENISFYIDFPTSDNKYEKYSLLPYSKWELSGVPLEMYSGLPVWEDENTSNGSFFSRYDILNQTDGFVSDYYRMQFLTVGNKLHLSDIAKESFPGEVKDLFPEELTELEPAYWLKVTFPPHISAVNLHDLTICINAFPVANKILYSEICKCNNLTGIVPLRTKEGETFLSVENVTDSSGKEYKSIPYSSSQTKGTGVYSIKQGGMERFDERNAREYIERLIDLLRSESSAFSSMEMDNLRNIITGLQTGLIELENKLNNSTMTNAEIPSYLLLSTEDKDETIFVDYYATYCHLANGLRSGKVLTPLAAIPLLKNSCYLLKATSGGKPAPNSTGKLDAYRYALTARDQIYTHEDAKNFCLMELGENVTKVEVCRGITVSPRPKEGLVRTIDIFLFPGPGCKDTLLEMQTELLIMLHRKSPDAFNYRIIIKD